MEPFFTLLAFCAGNSRVTGEFPSQRPVMLNFDIFFDLRLNKRLSKKSGRRWFETPSRLLWRYCNSHIFACWQTTRPNCVTFLQRHRRFVKPYLINSSKNNILLPEINGNGFYAIIYDVIISAMASQITVVSIVYPTICPGADKKMHQTSAWLTFVRGIHRWPVNSPHKGSVTRIMFPFDDVIL